jgi:antitoxin component YwqK of YwqJK toxin-antitoxin module
MEVIKKNYSNSMRYRKYLYIPPVLFVTWLFFLSSCSGISKEKEEEITSSSFFIDTTQIPKDTILSTAPNLKLDNGRYYLDNKPFSGYRKGLYENKQVGFISSYLNGMQHGITLSYFDNGKLRDSRAYKFNKSFGKHYGYWENGNLKFEFYYLNDKLEGINKQWYVTGKPYTFLSFKDDKEDGMQQAWRENGKPYINYEAKDGFRYGLQKSGLCYTLIDEKLKTTK